jgi:hypothetical protein
MGSLLIVAGLAAIPLVSRNSSADQNRTSPVLKVESRIVLVDVVVTDGKGRFIGGLRKKDFQVAEDGKTQTI